MGTAPVAEFAKLQTAANFFLLSTAKRRPRAAAASALTGAQRKGLVPMGAFKGFSSSRVLTPEAAGSARVPSIPLQACAGV